MSFQHPVSAPTSSFHHGDGGFNAVGVGSNDIVSSRVEDNCYNDKRSPAPFALVGLGANKMAMNGIKFPSFITTYKQGGDGDDENNNNKDANGEDKLAEILDQSNTVLRVANFETSRNDDLIEEDPLMAYSVCSVDKHQSLSFLFSSMMSIDMMGNHKLSRSNVLSYQFNNGGESHVHDQNSNTVSSNINDHNVKSNFWGSSFVFRTSTNDTNGNHIYNNNSNNNNNRNVHEAEPLEFPKPEAIFSKTNGNFAKPQKLISSSLIRTENSGNTKDSASNDIPVAQRDSNENCLGVTFLLQKKAQQPLPIETLELATSATAESQKESSTCQKSKWLIKYSQLCDYRISHGHCCVPYNFENSALVRWVKRQRCQYKLLVDGKRTTLTQERMQMLEDVGFVWDSQRASWYERFDELKDFKMENGHSNVPCFYRKNPQLATWVKCQRRQYKLLLENKPSNMTPERKSAMDSIGFEWEARGNSALPKVPTFNSFV